MRESYFEKMRKNDCQVIVKGHKKLTLSGLLFISFKEQNWSQEDVSNVRNKGSNYPLVSHKKRNTETNIKQSPPYGTAPGIEC